MYAPPTYQDNVSVTHWDVALSPNELMEPFAGSSLDTLTVAAFADMGWPLCGLPFNVDVTGVNVSGTETFEACLKITVSNTTVMNGGLLGLQAPRVEFSDFDVESGGTLTVSSGPP